MEKTRVNISIDLDVLLFIDEEAARHREERSRYINRHFAELLAAKAAATAYSPISTDKSRKADQAKRKRAG